MSDLQPYMCTFPDCADDTRLFSTRSEWFQHEFALHRQQWVCNRCDRSHSTFTSAVGLQSHFSKVHPGAMTEAQIPLILEACAQPIEDFNSASCPLCNDWERPATHSSGRSFGRHLARHLQQLALEALPLSIEGLEICNDDEGQEEELSRSEESEDDLGDQYIQPLEDHDTEMTPQLENPKAAQTESLPEIVKKDAEDVEAALNALASRVFDAAPEQDTEEKDRDEAEALARREFEAKLKQNAEETLTKRQLRQAEDPAPKDEVGQATSPSDKTEESVEREIEAVGKKKTDRSVLLFKDTVGRKFAFPFRVCQRREVSLQYSLDKHRRRAADYFDRIWTSLSDKHLSMWRFSVLASKDWNTIFFSMTRSFLRKNGKRSLSQTTQLR